MSTSPAEEKKKKKKKKKKLKHPLHLTPYRGRDDCRYPGWTGFHAGRLRDPGKNRQNCNMIPLPQQRPDFNHSSWQ